MKIPRLSSIPTWDTSLHHPATLDAKTSTDKINTFYYKQVLDHFNYRPQSYRTFQQRYLINFKYWGGANSSAPILAFFGAEEAIDHSPEGIAFLTDNAASLNALLVYIEVFKFYRTLFFFQYSKGTLSLTLSNLNFLISTVIMGNQYHLDRGKKRLRMQAPLDISTQLKQ